MSTPNENSHSDSQPNLPQTPAVTLPRSTRGTILLVEDDRSIRRYLEVILQRAGYIVVSAGDGLEAMKAALSNTLDAVVTDASRLRRDARSGSGGGVGAGAGRSRMLDLPPTNPSDGGSGGSRPN